jgi:hypothetical protein
VSRAIAEIVHPRLFNASISMSSPGVNIETGLLSLAGRSATVSIERSPTPNVGGPEGGELQ